MQTLSQEYSTEKLNDELEYQKQLSTNYEHLQQQLTRCSSTLEQKLQLQEQIQYNIEQTHEDIEQMKRQLNNDQKVCYRIIKNKILSLNDLSFVFYRK